MASKPRALDAILEPNGGFGNGFPRSSPQVNDSQYLRAAVGRAKAGDTQAVHYLYVRYARSVYRYVRSIVHDDYEAEDITQAAFMAFFRQADRYEQRDVPFLAWIIRVARNLALDEMRRRRRLASTELVRLEAATEEPTLARESLIVALRRLPGEQRRVAVLRHLHGLSPAEIADRVGKSESAVNGLHHRARGALRQTLTDLGATPTTAPLPARDRCSTARAA